MDARGWRAWCVGRWTGMTRMEEVREILREEPESGGREGGWVTEKLSLFFLRMQRKNGALGGLRLAFLALLPVYSLPDQEEGYRAVFRNDRVGGHSG